VGSGIVIGGLLGRAWMFPVFTAGFVGGFVAMPIGRRVLRPLGRITPMRVLVIPAAIVLEIALISVVAHLYPVDSHSYIPAVLFVVGIHFLVFTPLSGPLCVLLALLCCANALVGLLVPSVPLLTLWIADGVIKTCIGMAMLRALAWRFRPRREPFPAS